jgi:hypothetical protein
MRFLGAISGVGFYARPHPEPDMGGDIALRCPRPRSSGRNDCVAERGADGAARRPYQIQGTVPGSAGAPRKFRVRFPLISSRIEPLNRGCEGSAGVLACEFPGRPALCASERRDAARTRCRDGCVTGFMVRADVVSDCMAPPEASCFTSRHPLKTSRRKI